MHDGPWHFYSSNAVQEGKDWDMLSDEVLQQTYEKGVGESLCSPLYRGASVGGYGEDAAPGQLLRGLVPVQHLLQLVGSWADARVLHSLAGMAVMTLLSSVRRDVHTKHAFAGHAAQI